MNRRKFLKGSSLTGLSLTSIGMASCNVSDKPHKETKEEKTTVFSDDFKLNEVSIDELQQKMQDGEYTSRSITEQYLKRIKEIDQNGPGINSVIEINPDALTMADDLDEERKKGSVRGPLHGIPVLLKDNINTLGKMMTTAGSLALDGHIAASDAFLVKKLREAGAVLLGKTNLSEWANFRSNRSASGWSSRGGQTRCPYVLDRNPSGSSSGSGAAVAANVCVVAIGTETDGSIVSPSSTNGIVGIKPTVGLVSRSGIIPISKTQDTAGPMAKTVKDAAILLGAITGIDTDDAVTKESEGKVQKDYTQFLDVNGLKGKRIGIEKNIQKGNEDVMALFQQAIELFKKQGASIIEIELFKPLEVIHPAEYTVLLFEFKDGVNKYLSTANAKVKSLADVISFNKQNETRAMPYFKQSILEESNAKGGLDSQEYTDALKKSLSSRKIIHDLMKRHKLDAISFTTQGLACCIDLVNGDYDTGFANSTPAAIAGYPHITVPMGVVHDLPVGISFMAGAYSEPELLKIAYAFEQASRKRVLPKFLETTIPAIKSVPT
jgi:amidase